jgi:hypothetical protein
VPDPELRKDEETRPLALHRAGLGRADERRHRHGPKTEDRLDLRRRARENSAWVRSVLLAA